MQYLQLAAFAIALTAPILADGGVTPALTWFQPIGGTATGQPDVDAQGNLYITGNVGGQVFVAKLDPAGNTLYKKIFGAAPVYFPRETRAALAVRADGSVYVTGYIASPNFPLTAGAYLTTQPSNSTGSNFVFKLNPDGSLAWSTYFPVIAGAIAVDAAGSVYLAGSTYGGLPTTAGAYQSELPSRAPCSVFSITPCPQPPIVGFFSKLKADGSALLASTYTYLSHSYNTYVGAIALAANGNVYLAGGPPQHGSPAEVMLMSPDGTALLGSSTLPCSCSISSVAVNAGGDVYVAGGGTGVPTTSGSFQSSVFPSGGLPEKAFVVKLDSALSAIEAATLLGGESVDEAVSVAIDPAGNVLVAGNTSSKGFPTRAPFQSSFSSATGFVAELDSGLSTLLFSTFVGDERYFVVAGARPDRHGNILLSGMIVFPNNFGPSGISYANQISLSPAPAVRLDSIQNAANQLAVALSPGERITVTGSGFGVDAELLLNGAPIPLQSQTSSRLTAVVPSNLGDSNVASLAVSSGGATSNAVVAPVAAASPGIYSVDGSGYGQGYILNSDGTLNSPSNPAAKGSVITMFVNGVGNFTLDGIYAVVAQPVAVFIDGVYAYGVAATLQPLPGVPEITYALSVYVPSQPYMPHATSSVLLVSAPVLKLKPYDWTAPTQPGLTLSVKQ